MKFDTVIRNDFRLIKRDKILVMMFLFIIYMGVVLRFLLPWVDRLMADSGILPNDKTAEYFSHYFPLILSHFIIFNGPQIAGFIYSLLILTEKDGGTLNSLLVSPLKPGKYFNYRMYVAFFSAFVFVMFMFYIVNINILNIFAMTALSLGASLIAPLIMLFLLQISDGKVQAFSYAKFITFGGLITVASWWVREPFQFIFGLFPPYWISKAYWTAAEGNGIWILYLGIGIVYMLTLSLLMRRYFLKNVYKDA